MNLKRLGASFALCLAVAATAPAMAEEPMSEDAYIALLEETLPGTLMNNPVNPGWHLNGTEGKLKVVRSPGAPGGSAFELKVKKAQKNFWDLGLSGPLTAGVEAGDAVVVAVWARSVGGPGSIQVSAQINQAPWTGISSGTITPGPEWGLHYVRGISAESHDASSLGLSLNAGSQKQTLQISQVYVLNYGQGHTLEDLPEGPAS